MLFSLTGFRVFEEDNKATGDALPSPVGACYPPAEDEWWWRDGNDGVVSCCCVPRCWLMWWKAKNRLLRERRRLRTGQVTSWWSTPPWQKDFTKSTDTTGSVSVYQWAFFLSLIRGQVWQVGCVSPCQWRCCPLWTGEGPATRFVPCGLAQRSAHPPRVEQIQQDWAERRQVQGKLMFVIDGWTIQGPSTAKANIFHQNVMLGVDYCVPVSLQPDVFLLFS